MKKIIGVIAAVVVLLGIFGLIGYNLKSQPNEKEAVVTSKQTLAEKETVNQKKSV